MTFEFSASDLLSVADKLEYLSESVTELYPSQRDVLLMACVMLRCAANKAEEEAA